MREIVDILESMTTEDRERVKHRFLALGRELVDCPRIIIPIGVPCSGKSTWTNAYLSSIKDTRKTFIASSDDQIDAYAKANKISYAQALQALNFDVLEKNMFQTIREAIAVGGDIIVDRTNVRGRSRRRWLSQVPKHYLRIAVDFEVPEEIIFERLKRREREINKSVPISVVKEMMASYQAPTFDEFDIIERITLSQ